MAKNTRKKSANRKPAKSRAKVKAKRKPAKAKGGRVSRAVRTVLGTIKDTDALRNKLEQPATSETE